MDERVNRISAAENALDKVVAANEQLTKALETYGRALDSLELFSDYYGSSEWFDDREASERGELPESLKRGVLSEDAPYDALVDTRALALDMLDVATNALRIV